MKRYLLLLASALLLGSCSTPEPEGEALIVERIRMVQQLRAEAGRSWPALLRPEYDVPLLYYTDSVCYAVNPTQHFLGRMECRPMHEEKGLNIRKCARPDSLPFHMQAIMSFDD